MHCGHGRLRGRRGTTTVLALLALSLVVGIPAALGTSTPVMVQDIDPAGGSSPHGLVTAGGTVFFAASDGSTGTELWKSEGTGATLVKDVNPGAGDGVPGVFSVPWTAPAARGA